MEIIFYIILFISFFISLLSVKVTKDIFNPSVLTMIFWGLPVLFSSLKLSSLQSHEWADKTYMIIIYSMIAFVVIPGIFLVFTRVKNTNDGLKQFAKVVNTKVILIISFITIMSYFLENLIASNSLIPALYSTNGLDVHTVSVSGLLIITRSFIPITVLFLYICYKITKEKKYILLLIILLLLPFTRLARFDIIMAVIPLFGVIFYYSEKKRIVLRRILTLGLLIAILGSALGEYRMTHGYKYSEISYSEGIQFKTYSGPFDVFAVLYGYFALSVENLDRFVKENDEFSDYQYGKIILRPVTAGIFQMNNIFEEYPLYEYVNNLRNPLIGYATVHTAFVDFSLDFGYYFSILLMLLFSMISLLFYFKSFKHMKYKIYYLLYAQGFAFLSFQNLFIEARLLYQILTAFFIFSISSYLYNNKQRNKQRGVLSEKNRNYHS